MTSHSSPHPLAGQTVTATPAAPLNGVMAGPLHYRIEDWNDRVFGRSWMTYDRHPASLAYAVRAAIGQLPTDNEVVYGKDDFGIGHLIHVTELQDGGQ
ncbi:hypothetical protein ACWEG1_05695 [Streptomyces bauhiniae]